MRKLSEIKDIVRPLYDIPDDIELLKISTHPNRVYYAHVEKPHNHEPIEVIFTVSNGPERRWLQCKHCGKPM